MKNQQELLAIVGRMTSLLSLIESSIENDDGDNLLFRLGQLEVNFDWLRTKAMTLGETEEKPQA